VADHDDLVEASSLGSPGARLLQERTSAAEVDAVRQLVQDDRTADMGELSGTVAATRCQSVVNGSLLVPSGVSAVALANDAPRNDPGATPVDADNVRLGPEPRNPYPEIVDLRLGTVDPLASIRRVRLGGCLVDLVTPSVVCRVLSGHLGRPPGTGTLLVASANLDHITHFANRPGGDGLDPDAMDDWLVLLGGMSLVHAASRLAGVEYPRLAGADLLPELFGIAETCGRSVVILGGRPEIREPLATAMGRQWPDLRVLAHLTPTRLELVDPVSSSRLQAEIAALHPDLLVVCLGKPLQERWMARYARGTGAKVAVGFGAAIDFIAGTVPRAPRWMQDHGLEWSYRLAREPRRMARRYLIQAPVALAKLRSDVESWPVVDGPGTVPAPPADRGVRVHPGAARPERTSRRRRGPCTAVVVTYQSGAHIAGLLEALQAEREAGLELDVLVVDNASTDGTADVVAGFGWVRWVAAGDNLGYAAGVNVGDRLAPPGQPLLVLNPDLVPAPGAVGRLLEALDHPEVGVVVPRIEDDDGKLSPSLRHEPSLGRAVIDSLLGRHAATGAALLVSGACRAAVGEWDERFLLYPEETDYLRRVRAAGLQIRYLPDIVMRHIGGGSGTSDALHALSVVNSVRYYRRYHAWPSTLALGTVTALCELLRAWRPESRLALRALLSARARSGLPGPGASTSPSRASHRQSWPWQVSSGKPPAPQSRPTTPRRRPRSE
jgi:exopolysaccharide biosynthesis WecB/TagA/CpsF family protein